jgi:hypothetical protein
MNKLLVSCILLLSVVSIGFADAIVDSFGSLDPSFDKAVYGTLMLDYYDDSISPDQLSVFGAACGKTFIASLVGGGMELALVSRYAGWHTLALVYGVDSTAAYADGVIAAAFDYDGGCSTVFCSELEMIGGSCFD